MRPAWKRFPRLAAIPAICAAALLGCGSSDDADDRASFEAGLRDVLEARAVPGAYTDCLVEASRTAVSDDQLASLSNGDDALEIVTTLGPAMQQMGIQCQASAAPSGY